MLFNSVKVSQMYNELDSYKLKDILYDWGYTSLTNRYPCIGHDETVPSMDVDDEHGIFHCFSCGRGGKVGKMIAYYYEVNFGIKNELEALERFLQDNSELRNKLGFVTLRQTSTSLPKQNILDIKERAELKLKSKNTLEEIELKNIPLESSKDLDSILKYVIKLQNGHLAPANIRR